MNDFIVWMSTRPAFAWLVRHVLSPLDPIVFRATGGRFILLGPAAVPMVAITMEGRKSGQPRTVQLACLEHDDAWYVVASAMGQERHPAWRYNLEANPDVELQMRGERFAARAEVLSEVEKEEVWDEIREAIPQMRVYEKRTDRNIRVFRLSRVGS